MPNPLEKIVAEKKEVIETAMEMFEKGAEVVASAVGEIFPICEVAAPVLRLALDQVESKEVRYVKEQFQVVRNKLDVISDEVEVINREIKKSLVDSKYFEVEENLQNQFRKYMDILNAKPQFKEVKKKLFLDHFSRTGGEMNLLLLYDAVMGHNVFGESILEIALNYEGKNRRVLEDLFTRLKELFCIGLIALLGHAAVTNGDDESLIREWNGKMLEVETKMKSLIDECIGGFAEQAQVDTEKLMKEKNMADNRETAEEIHGFLKRKYDWVNWSVRVYKHSGSSFSNWRAGDKYHCVTGKHCFGLLQINNSNVVVSYSSNPLPVDKDHIRQLMEGQYKKADATNVAEHLSSDVPGCVVHAVSRYKEIWASWNFPDECHYWENHKNVSLCVHSE